MSSSAEPSPIKESISREEAVRAALAAQGFGRRPAAGINRSHLKKNLNRLGLLQIDSVNALVRAHYLPLFSRLGSYAHEDLDHLAWGPAGRRHLFECWAHEASLVPLESYPLMRWRMTRAAKGDGIYSQLAEFGRREKGFIRQVKKEVEDRGAIGAGALGRTTGGWWGWSPAKMALEWLFAAGEVTIAGRKSFERLYDLTERVIPAKILSRPVPTEAEAQRRLLLMAAEALGVATARDLGDYYRLKPGVTKACLAGLIDEGQLVALGVEGWKDPAYARPDLRIPKRIEATALLSPFDSLVWERSRTERLFNFHYRLEFYTPPPKRVYGYYVLPFLHGRELVGRVDLRAERGKCCLTVPAVYAEGDKMTGEALAAQTGNLKALANWLGLEKVVVKKRSGLDSRLRSTLNA
ncbi:winged helix-turn-helix domain-containing protein [Deltaproteobacteria bacterium OttesenSCG-928-M10]|nr:winged helix-turn-helix domain-containing protein [Deltaproteobacteria bacterium OttesenSCG-928-M10]